VILGWLRQAQSGALVGKIDMSNIPTLDVLYLLGPKRKFQMNAKTAFVAAAIFVSIASPLVVGSPARATDESASYAAFTALTCASGYHLGPNGNCQPKYHAARRCPHGFRGEPFPNGNGYRCVAISGY
jgi:hypothetical protein